MNLHYDGMLQRPRKQQKTSAFTQTATAHGVLIPSTTMLNSGPTLSPGFRFEPIFITSRIGAVGAVGPVGPVARASVTPTPTRKELLLQQPIISVGVGNLITAANSKDMKFLINGEVYIKLSAIYSGNATQVAYRSSSKLEILKVYHVGLRAQFVYVVTEAQSRTLKGPVKKLASKPEPS